jgi:predicted permease
LLEELAYHRELKERELIRNGMSPEAARDEARRAMGNETLMRENARAVWLWPSLEAIWQDATYTLRDLRRNPTFTLGVVLTLALGIGANAAMFSLVDRLLFRAPARMLDPDAVNRVYLYRTSRGVERTTGSQYARQADIARWTTSFSKTAMHVLQPLAIGTGAETRVRNVAVVSASFFEFFEAPPAIGRYFTAGEDTPENPAAVAVLSHDAWQSQFGGRDVIGKMVRIDAVAYSIIGVAPSGFVGLWPYRPPAAFIPVTTYAASEGPRDWVTTYGHAFGLETIARRKPGVSAEAAGADLTNALRRSYQAQSLSDPISLDLLRPRAVAASILIERGPEPTFVSRAATWLSGVTVIVLLIACANVANLLLARSIRRRREIGVRVALGVSRSRLVGQLLTEGLVLALMGGVAGTALAMWGGNLLRATFLPGTEQASLLSDARTLIFTGVVAVGVGILTGLAPMVQVLGDKATADLRGGARGGTPARTRLRTALLLLQAGLSVVLLVGAGLFVQSLRNVRSVRLGFDPEPVLLVSLEMRDAKLDTAAMAALRLRLLASVMDVPGVSQATLQESVPFGGMSSLPIVVEGIDSTARLGQFRFNTVSSDYFATMGTRLLRGRGIASTDIEGAPRVAVVGQSMAAVLWPGQNPVGRCFRIAWPDTAPCTYVVGVAENIRSESIDDDPKLFYYYMPAAQFRPHDGGLFVRVRDGGASRMIEPVRLRLQRDMPGASYVTVRRLGDIVDAKLRSWITGAKVFTVFGVLALLLAAVGLYSVIAYDVTQRRHELGVRLALGAARGRIVRLVVMRSMRLALSGVVLGAAVAWAAGRWIAPLLFQQTPHDPAVFALVAVTLLSVAIVASSVPALRAAMVDPRTALQSD